jgi:glycosyltransferase involved in cell wall biosynthesis
MGELIESLLCPIDRLLAKQSGAPASFEPGEMKHERTAWILSYTGVTHEPRVVRQAWSLARHNWNVVVAGFLGNSPRPPDWSLVRLADRGRSRAIPFRGALFLQRQLGRLLYRYAKNSPTVSRFGARLYYFGLANWRQNHREIVRIAEAMPHLKPDLVIAHDFHTCPPAAILAKRWGAAFIVDCHEYARGQYMDNPVWVRDGRLFATAIQDDYLARADAVTTVSDGIRDLLNREQSLKRSAVTIRSMPLPQPQPFRATGDRIKVLYHGLLSADRGLEEAVESLRLWHPRFSFVLRGEGESHVVDRLRRIAERNGVLGRLSIEPSVPFAEIVPTANKADIGYFVQHGFSPQKRLTLPNKFFEYVMAGVALCVSDLPEMAKLVERYRLGKLIEKPDPNLIAGTINSFTNEEIDRHKASSLSAAQHLNWLTEEPVLLQLCEDITGLQRATVRISSSPSPDADRAPEHS